MSKKGKLCSDSKRGKQTDKSYANETNAENHSEELMRTWNRLWIWRANEPVDTCRGAFWGGSGGGWIAFAMRCSCVCDFWINFNAPLSGFCVTLPSVWGPVEMTSEQALTTAQGTQRSLGAGESVYERFITDVTLICHALSGSCSKAHIVNGFFLWLKSSLAKSCRWDGDCLG